MLVGDEQPHVGLFRQTREGDIRRVAFLHFHHAQMRAAALQQIDNVAIFGDHPLQLNLRVTQFELLHQLIVMLGLIGIGEHHAQARFDLARQLNAQRVEPLAGGEDRLHMPQHFAAGGGEHRLARAAIEQRQCQVGLQIGDGGADGGLAFAQLARGGGKRAEGGGFDKRVQRFRGIVHKLSTLSMVSIFNLPKKAMIIT